MSVFTLLVIVHTVAARVWTGGHLVLDLGVLPVALRERSATQIRSVTALAIAFVVVGALIRLGGLG